MAFSQATIEDVFCFEVNGDLVVTWTSSAPEGTVFQLYVDRRLTWYGTDRTAYVPLPATTADFAVGTVGPGEDRTDFSGSLPAPVGTGDQVTLTWTGGTYEDEEDDLKGFYVYQSPGPGLAIDYTTSIAAVAAYPLGILEDGFGIGGFGEGGFGRAASHYAWKSQHLANGTWSWGVRSFDAPGNLGTARTFTATIHTVPGPPAVLPGGLRMTYTYNPSTRIATLSWGASPG